MDEVARCVSTALTVSNGVRRDTEVTILFVAEPPPNARRIRVDGARVRFLNPDERSTAALLKNALVRAASAEHDLESSPGLVVGPVDPQEELRRFLGEPGALWLTELGEPLRTLNFPPGGFAAVLSDPTDPLTEEERILLASGVPKVSVGPRSLRSSQVIDLVHNEFDLREGALGGASTGPDPGP